MTALALNPPLRTIRLYGEAGTRFGRVHRLALDTNTVAEAVQALCALIPGLRAYLTQAKDRGIGFAVFAGKKNLTEKELKIPVGRDDIRIAPIIMGSKQGGVLSIILGVVLVVVGAVLTAYGYGVIGEPMIKLGVAMIAGGVIQMLSPQPKGISKKENPAGTPSYAFSGPVNTEAQGHPVPYFGGGPLWIGSAVISAGIDVTDNAHSALPPPSGSGSLGYGGDLYGTRVSVP